MKTTESLIAILRTSNIEDSVKMLLDCVSEMTEKRQPSLFLLSTQRSAFYNFTSNETRHRSESLDPNRYIISKRDGLVIGYVDADCDAQGLLSSEECGLIGAVIEMLYRRVYVYNFLQNIRRPVDFTKQDSYYLETARMLADALSMEMVVIRQLNSEGSLRSHAFYRYPDNFDTLLDFEVEAMPVPFVEVIEKTKEAINDCKLEQLRPTYHIINHADPRYAYLRDYEQLKDVRTLVLFPIVIGDEFFGVVSCGTTAAFQFSPVEEKAMETAMQIVGVAISNFTSYREAKRISDVLLDQLLSITALEIAQSARHELQNIHTELALEVDELQDIVKLLKAPRLAEKLSGLARSVDQMDEAIKKLRYNAGQDDPKLEETTIREVWDSAVELVKQRLKVNDIRTEYIGPEGKGWFYPVWLQEAFLNLLLNSMDAFRNRPKRNRWIKLVIQKESSAAHDFVLDYSDSAGGISFQNLKIPEQIKKDNPGMRPEELIFQPKVTSKKNRAQSAGWGLHLVR